MRTVTFLRAGSLPLLFLFGCVQSTVTQDSNPGTSGVKIVARYHAGESLWRDWKYTITGDGKVDAEIFEMDGHWSKEQKKLSSADIADILAIFKEAEFQSLRARYSANGTDIARMTLVIAEGEQTKAVSVDAHGTIEETDEVKRFRRIWSAILTKIPSPNPEQQPEFYATDASTSRLPSRDEKVH